MILFLWTGVCVNWTVLFNAKKLCLNFLPLVFRCFDLDADNYISYDEFMKGMSVFLKGKWEERLKCNRKFVFIFLLKHTHIYVYITYVL